MSAAPDVAKALSDALPSLDFKKLVEDARRHWNVVVVGEAEPAAELLRLLRGDVAPPTDVHLTLWYHGPDGKKQEHIGKTELVIVVGATEASIRFAREQFKDVPQLPLLLGEQETPDLGPEAVRVPAIDEHSVQKTIIPAMVEHLWERRVPLGRALPPARDRIARVLIQRALTNPRSVLSWVAGSASGRNGTPTPATAALLVQQAALIVAMGAIYGESLESQRALIARVVPYLTPTLTLDLAEAWVSGIVKNIPDKSPFKTYEKIAALGLAVLTRSSFSATSTLLAGTTARRVFRGKPRTEAGDAGNPILQAAARSRDLGKRALAGTGQGVTTAAHSLADRLRRQDAAPSEAEDDQHETPGAAAPDPAFRDEAAPVAEDAGGEGTQAAHTEQPDPAG